MIEFAVELAFYVAVLGILFCVLLLVGFVPQNALVMTASAAIGMTIRVAWDYRELFMGFINGPESEE
jgi:hypothetical protein